MDTYIAEHDEGGGEWDAVKLSRLVAEERRVQEAFLSYVEKIRVEGTRFADAELRFEFGEWTLKRLRRDHVEHLAWAVYRDGGWRICEPSSSNPFDLADVRYDGLTEEDAVAALIAIGGFAIAA